MIAEYHLTTWQFNIFFINNLVLKKLKNKYVNITNKYLINHQFFKRRRIIVRTVIVKSGKERFWISCTSNDANRIGQMKSRTEQRNKIYIS